MSYLGRWLRSFIFEHPSAAAPLCYGFVESLERRMVLDGSAASVGAGSAVQVPAIRVENSDWKERRDASRHFTNSAHDSSALADVTVTPTSAEPNAQSTAKPAMMGGQGIQVGSSPSNPQQTQAVLVPEPATIGIIAGMVLIGIGSRRGRRRNDTAAAAKL